MNDASRWRCIIDHEDDIDWDYIAATTEEDEKSGKLAFSSADYATHEEAMAALRAWIHGIAERVKRNATSDTRVDASR
jgi:SAM-dependent MidA family methyltransferase